MVLSLEIQALNKELFCRLKQIIDLFKRRVWWHVILVKWVQRIQGPAPWWWTFPLIKLREKICRPLQMSHKLQSSTLDNFSQVFTYGALLGALQGQHYLAEINGNWCHFENYTHRNDPEEWEGTSYLSKVLGRHTLTWVRIQLVFTMFCLR